MPLIEICQKPSSFRSDLEKPDEMEQIDLKLQQDYVNLEETYEATHYLPAGKPLQKLISWIMAHKG